MPSEHITQAVESLNIEFERLTAVMELTRIDLTRVTAAIAALDGEMGDAVESTGIDPEPAKATTKAKKELKVDGRKRPKPVTCDVCGRKFKGAAGLGSHMRQHRLNDKDDAAEPTPEPTPEVIVTESINTRCAQCGSQYANRRDLLLHGRKFSHDIDDHEAVPVRAHQLHPGQ